jgi:cation transport regulator
MPYKSNDDLPDAVKGSLPADAQTIFREAFNSAREKDPDEEKAAQAAWGAVKNAGYEKDDAGKWAEKQDHSETYDAEFEVFSAGIHDGDVYTEKDLDDITRNFAELKTDIKPPLKFGHRNRMHISDGQPALGWATELKRVGQKLIAKFSHIPEVVYHAIKKKLYSRISSEILWDFKYKGKNYSRVFWAAGLLGQDIPIVKDLADLQAFMSRSTPPDNVDGGSFGALKVCEFAYDDDGTTLKLHGGETMTDQEKKDLEAKLATEKAAREKAEADAKKYSEQLDARKAEDAARKKAECIAEIKTFCEQMVKDGRMLPAGRDIIAGGLDSNLHVYSEDTGFGLSFDQFKKYAELQGKVLPLGENAKGGKAGTGQEFDTAGEELDAKAKKYSRDHKVSYSDAISAVMAEDKDLAERYANEAKKSDEN